MVYLFDNIGTESGMHYYDAAFVKLMTSNNVKIKVISNYDDSYVIKKLPNYFKGDILKKIISLIRFFSYYLIFVRKNINTNQFIFQSFGMSFLDMFFIFPFVKHKNYIVVIHDFRNIQKRNKFEFLQNFIYKRLKNVIIHNQNIESLLKKEGFSGNIFYVPHFHYLKPSNSNGEINVDPKLKSYFEKSKGKVKILFFGTIRISKGIDILMECLLKNDFQEYEFFIAGKDKYQLLSGGENKFLKKKNIHIFDRYISDEELNYLFDKCDFAILPYKEIFQSGVLETAVNHKLPMVLSNIEYFRLFLSVYPSFGILFDELTADSLTKTLHEIKGLKKVQFYKKEDLKRFYEKQEFISFIREFKKQFGLLHFDY